MTRNPTKLFSRRAFAGGNSGAAPGAGARRGFAAVIAQVSVAAGLLALGLLGGCATHGDYRSSRPGVLRPFMAPQTQQNARRLFNATNPDARRAAIAYFSRQPYGHRAPYMAAYRLLTTDPNPLVRGQALLALGTSRQPSVAPYLIKGLHDKTEFVRRDAAVALEHVQAPAAVPTLLHLLATDPSSQVRATCALALHRYDQRRVVRGLINALDDHSIAVARFAWDSLRRLTGQNYPLYAAPWLRWFRAQPRPSDQEKILEGASKRGR